MIIAKLQSSVRSGVLRELVHALGDADPGRQVEDRVDAVERPPHHLGGAEVTGDQVDLGVQVRGSHGLAVHLLDEAVERTHVVARADELVRQMGADEAGPARDENAFEQA